MSKKFIYVNTDGLQEESAGAYEESDFISSSAGAGDAGKPVVLDGDGKIDATMIDSNDIDESVLDHNSLNNLTVGDPHTQYVKKAGDTMSGDLAMGGNEVTGLPSTPSGATAATSKAYVDSVATGLRPKGNVAVATTANITLSGLQTIDTYSVQVGDRVLVKDQTDATENGIYVAAAGAWTRSEDQDNAPLAEIVNGVFIPTVLNGSANVDTPFFISSVGTGTDGVHTIGVDDIIFDIFTSPTQLQAGDGIDIIANVISTDLLASGGLKIVSGELAVEPNDFAGDGLIDDGSDNLAIDWATVFTIDGADAKAFKASDIASTSNGKGASIVGVEDLSAYFTGTDLETVLNELEAQIGGDTSGTFNFTEDNVLADNDALYAALDKLDLKWGDLASNTNGEGASLVGIEDAGGYTTETTVEGSLQELYSLIAENGVLYTVGVGGVTKGDLVYVSSNDTVLPYSTLTDAHRGIGLALTTEAAAASVKVLANDTVLTSVLVGATAGDVYYWNGTTFVNTIPAGGGTHVWQVGVAKNATDLHVEVQFVKKNA